MTEYKICGILHLSSRISYGVTKDGIIKKFTAFIPFDYCNNIYKIFYVKTKKSFSARDWYCVITFNGIDKTNNSIGSIYQYIGEIGDYEAEMNCIKMICLTNEAKLWKNNKIFQKEYNDDIYQNRKILDNREIYSIDPDNCIDIDDALHCIKNGDHYEIGIHIADVSSYIYKNSALDLELFHRSKTLYLKNEQINMLPPELVELCSLIQKKKRRSFSIIILLDENYNILDVKFDHYLIIVRNNLTYDNAQKIIDNNKIKTLNLLYEVGKHLHKMDQDKLYDTHVMVENYMILANTLVAEKLYNINKNQILLRNHLGARKELYKKDKIDPYLLHQANILLMDRAEYCMGNINNIDKLMHNGLGKRLYTHYTSPMRRYFDILVHRKLSGDEDDYSHLIKHINDSHNHYNKYEKLSYHLEQIYHIQEIYSDVIIIKGNIIYLEDHKIKIYIKEWDMIVDSILFSDQLLHLVNISRLINDDDDMILIRSIQLIDHNKEIILRMFQEITIQVAITNSLIHKLLVKVIDPNIADIFK